MSIEQEVLLVVSMHDGINTHDLYVEVGGMNSGIKRNDFYPILKKLVKDGKLKRGTGEDSRGKFGFKWSIP